MRLTRFIRRRYPCTTVAALYTLAAVAMLWCAPSRKIGELMLIMLAVAIANVIAQHAGRR